MALLSINNATATIDTGLGIGNGGAVINSTEGGFVNTTTTNGVANLNFQGDTHVNWDTLNVNSNETLKFNAVNNSSGFTVLNTVNNNMSQIYSRISIDPNIGKVIISNPNGVLFDGTKFDVVAANNFVITTAQMNATFNNLGKMNVTQQPFTGQSGDIIFQHLKYNQFFIDGEFTIIAPKIFFDGSNGFKFVTTDGQNFVYKLKEDNSHIPIEIGVASLDGFLQDITGNSSNSSGETSSSPGNNNQNTGNTNTEVQPWQDSETIIVNDDDNSGNITGTDVQTGNNSEVGNQENSNVPIVINTELEPWQDGGSIEIDLETSSITKNTATKTERHNVAAQNKSISNTEIKAGLEVSTKDFLTSDKSINIVVKDNTNTLPIRNSVQVNAKPNSSTITVQDNAKYIKIDNNTENSTIHATQEINGTENKSNSSSMNNTIKNPTNQNTDNSSKKQKI